MIGGVVGTASMSLYWKALSAAGMKGLEEAENPAPGPLDDIAVAGRLTKRGESSTQAVGRLVFAAAAGHDPETRETKDLLSQAVHWGYGAVQGGVYGTLRGNARPPDLAGGGVFGALLWAVSALGLPLAGLAKGPTAFPASRHAAEGGAHLVYGWTTSAVTQWLWRIL